MGVRPPFVLFPLLPFPSLSLRFPKLKHFKSQNNFQPFTASQHCATSPFKTSHFTTSLSKLHTAHIFSLAAASRRPSSNHASTSLTTSRRASTSLSQLRAAPQHTPHNFIQQSLFITHPTTTVNMQSQSPKYLGRTGTTLATSHSADHSNGSSNTSMGIRISSSDDPAGSGQHENPTNTGAADGSPHHTSSHDASDAAYEQAYQAWLSTQSSNPHHDDSDTDSEAGEESGEYPLLPVECFLRRYRLSDGYFSRPPMFFLLDETEEERCVRQSVEQVQAELAYGQFSWWCRFHFGRDPYPIHPMSDADKVNLAYRMGKMDNFIRKHMFEKYHVDWKRDAQTYDTLTLPQIVDTHMKRKYGFSWLEEPEHSSEDYEPGVIYWAGDVEDKVGCHSWHGE